VDPEVVEVVEVMEEEPKPILILVDERESPEGGVYSFTMETENGIQQSEVGTPGVAGQTNVKGMYRYQMEDGTVVEVNYVADELGFQVDTPMLPIAPEFPHPIPQYVLDQITFAEEQRRLLAIQLEQEAKELQEAKLKQEASTVQETVVEVEPVVEETVAVEANETKQE